MTSAALAETLIERGIDPTELDAKRDLFQLVLAGFERAAARFPQHVWWVPGRLEVFGKHTDYAGGRTLICALPRGFAVVAAPRRDGLVRVIDARSGDSVTLQPTTPTAALGGWHHYVEVVAQRLARNFPGHAISADVAFASDLPPAAGMSSSSALMVGVATALIRVAGIDSSREWNANVKSPLDAAGYYACIENGSAFGTLEGDAGVGTHGGSEDHAAILTGTAGHLSAMSFVPMRPIGRSRMPDDWRFVLASSGIAAEKTGAALAPYNRLSEGTRLLLQVWNSQEAQAASLGAALASSPQAVDRLRDLVRGSTIAGWSSDALTKRLDHFVREDARILEALDAFSRGDRARVAALAHDSQVDAETRLGNQVPETSSLARTAEALGAHGACSFGAGFGGSVWALVDRSAANEFAPAWHRRAFVASPGPALTEL